VEEASNPRLFAVKILLLLETLLLLLLTDIHVSGGISGGLNLSYIEVAGWKEW